MDRARNCDGTLPPKRPLFYVRLPRDKTGGAGDPWYRCPWAPGAIDPGAVHMIRLFWAAQSERAPLVSGPIDEWPVTTLTLCRIIREQQNLAREKTPDRANRTAAEAQRKQQEAQLLGTRRRGGHHVG